MVVFDRRLYPELTDSECQELVGPLLVMVASFLGGNQGFVEVEDEGFFSESYPFEALCKSLSRALWNDGWDNTLSPILSDSRRFAEACCDELAQQAYHYLLRSFIDDINSARSANCSPEEGYSLYIKRVIKDSFRSFSAKYTIGWSRCLNAMRLKVASINEAVSLIQKHRDSLSDNFAIPQELKIVEIHQAGDTHNCGRAVTVVEFEDGKKVVFKPRSVSGERGYHRLTNKLRKMGLATLPAIRAIDFGTYGFTEYVDYVDARGDLVTVGKLAALFYFLDAVDMHYSNIFWTSAGPVPVDLESLFHPARLRRGKQESSRSAYRELERSVYGTGILPRVITSSKNPGSIDVGFASTSQRNGNAPFKAMRIKNAFRDDIQATWASNPASDGSLLDGDSYESKVRSDCSQIETGFKEFFSAVLQHQDAFIEAVETSFADLQLRYIHCPTIQYTQILQSLTGSGATKDPDLVIGLLARISIPSVTSDFDLVKSECRQLWNGDIPYFSLRFNEKTVFGENSEICSVTQSPRELFRQKVESSSETELKAQLRILRLAFVAKLADPHSLQRFSFANNGESAVATTPQFVDGEFSASEVLRRLALPLAERVLDDRFDHLPRTWIGPVARFGSAEWSPGVLGYDLYAGRVGPALALAQAGKQLNNSLLLQPAYEVFGRSAEILNSSSFELRSLLSAGCGGYSGIPGLFWSLNAAGRCLGERSWVEISNKSWDILASDLGHMTTDSFDMINGTSSAIIMQLKSTGTFPYDESIIASWASIAMRRIEQRAQDLTVGLAHGLAHIIWFFSEIAKVCPTVECHKLVQYADTLISDNYRNRDGMFQSYADPTRDSFSLSWCNGHAGLLLAYASAAEANIETKVHCSEILRQIVSDSVSLIPVLCHGGLGVLEALRTVGRLYPDAQRTYDVLAASAFTEMGILSFFEQEEGRYALSPGLMCGRAGAILYLANKHSSDHKLSVLSLDF